MPLREEFERTGNWLFRWRSYLPAFLIVPMLAAMRQPHPLAERDYAFGLWALFCMAISLCGLGIRIFTIGHTPRGTSGRNTKEGQIAESLNTSGIYSVVRHPLYLGNFVIWIGVSLYCMIWWLPVIFALAFWIYYERIMFAEEEFLRRKFGDVYVQWAEKTPAFLPNFRGWQPPNMPFSLRTVIRRENPGLFGIITVFFALEAYERLVVERQFIIEPVWTSVFLTGAAVYLIVRTLKRRTNLLTVEGR